ncbi:hypothetical protein EDC04DRAFT_2604265 [Pisolithus marmoratus]|nr:hypothetical protein EDC04DRAFT_2604265 [Pisolithus marmoratus]
MARTKQTARKVTGDHAARINLYVLQKKRGKAKRKKQKATPNLIFMTSQVASLPAALVHLHLEALEVGHSQVKMLHSFLENYFPKGGYKFSQLGFDLATPESMEVYEKAASNLAQSLSPYSRVVLIITTHSDEERGDLFAGLLHGEAVSSKVLEVLELLLTPLKDVVKGADMIFNVCGSIVTKEKSFKDVKKAAQIFNPRSMILFDAPHLQLAATGPYLHSLLDNTIIQGFDVSSAALFALHDSAMLGRHSNIILITWESEDLVVVKLVWTDKKIRPWGNHLPLQCPQCGTIQKWEVGSGKKALPYECNYMDCGKNMGLDGESLPPKSFTFTMPKNAKQLEQGKKGTSSWLKFTL